VSPPPPDHDGAANEGNGVARGDDGFVVTSAGEQVPRIQIMTPAELFQGKQPLIPNVGTAMSKAAPEEKRQAMLDL